MPPKQRVVIQSSPASRRNQPTGYLGGIYHELTAPENQSVVRSIAIFGVSASRVDVYQLP
jgi:hypothetical protein